MKILSVNSGSSSLKLSLFETQKNFNEIAKIHIDGIKKTNCEIIFKSKTHEFNLTMAVKTHEEAFEIGIFSLIEAEAIKDRKEINAVGHRVVHGGEIYTKPTLIDKNVEKKIQELSSLAPLHNPVNLETIKIAKKLFNLVPHIAIFDTAFHQTIEEKNYLYAIPREFYEKHKIRRYGFHGINHKFVIEKAIKLLNKKNAKIISVHLGNGSSICASIGGKSIETSMGFTPLEGIIMGTRSGSIDPGIIFYVLENLKIRSKNFYKTLNEESGLKAISEISHDMREIYASSLAKDEKAILAIEMLSNSISKTIASYLAVLDGADAIVFTGGLGEKAFYVREKAIANLKFAGIKLDKTKNKKLEMEISSKDSKSKIFVIESDEQKEIAIETQKFIEENK